MTSAAKKRIPVKKATSRVTVLPVARATSPVVADAEPAQDKGLLTLARDLRSLTGFVRGIANTAADRSLRVASARLTRPSHKAAVEKAGGLFRDLREGAGLTLSAVRST